MNNPILNLISNHSKQTSFVLIMTWEEILHPDDAMYSFLQVYVGRTLIESLPYCHEII